MHWELEFADLFAKRGGFDLVIGNPPWIKMEWNEYNILSDSNPLFVIKALSAADVALQRKEALTIERTKEQYYQEYVSLSGMQNFLNALSNYSELKGMSTNLYKCFLPTAWRIGHKKSTSAFIHPDGVYNKARKQAHKAINNPINTEGTGRDMILYYTQESVDINSVDSLFVELQAQHREYEKSLNKLKAEIKETLNDLIREANNKYRYLFIVNTQFNVITIHHFQPLLLEQQPRTRALRMSHL
jgi:phage-related protein